MFKIIHYIKFHLKPILNYLYKMYTTEISTKISTSSVKIKINLNLWPNIIFIHLSNFTERKLRLQSCYKQHDFKSKYVHNVLTKITKNIGHPLSTTDMTTPHWHNFSSTKQFLTHLCSNIIMVYEMYWDQWGTLLAKSISVYSDIHD